MKKLKPLDKEAHNLPDPKTIVTPTFSENTAYCLAELNGVTVVGLVSDEEAFLIPVALFENMIAYYGEVAYGILLGEEIEDEDDDTRTIN